MSRRRVTARFCLYVAGGTQNSETARINFTALCRNYFDDHCEIEIVDVLRDPERALEDGILMTPTLIKLWPVPARRIVGTLSQTQLVLNALNIEVAAA